MTTSILPGTTGSSSDHHPATSGADPHEPGDDLAAVFAHGHEQVVFCRHAESGLQAVIALYSTALGPGLGGTRFRAYPTIGAAVADVLDLSRAMAYKNSLAGLDHGGGKAVIIGDPRRDKTEALLRAYGRFVASLGGRYVTACDVGTYVEDMDVVARECRWVTGRSEADGGAGDSSVLTALGVFHGMRAGALVRWGTDSLQGRTVGISGVGKVGRHLVPLLLAAGARPVVADIDDAAVTRVLSENAGVRAVGSTEALLIEPLDAYAPCALGGVLTPQVAHTLRAGVVCGGANNQLATPEVARLLQDRDILYCPDYCVNAGGVIQVADELHGFSFERAKARTERIFDTTLAVLRAAAAEGDTPAEAADRLAERRMREIGGLSRIHVG
ncbi:MAG TPA: Glu/Leu/Phe/Val dehydrogenase dimerization domain-containing protein [Kineosporiaceae bacterium]|nr:Glu/Leu/Phe/Val dehydrogenase dimerization domain-containing protein [Kineosporiaceae bacterium]